MSRPFATTRRVFLEFLSAAGAALALGSAARGGAEDGAGSDEMTVTSNVMVKMRDGVHLASDVYRPKRNGQVVTSPLPVILERTPNCGQPLGTIGAR